MRTRGDRSDAGTRGRRSSVLPLLCERRRFALRTANPQPSGTPRLARPAVDIVRFLILVMSLFYEESRIRQRRDTRKHLAFEQFERRAAAGGAVGDLVVGVPFRRCRRRVAAADDGDGAALGRLDHCVHDRARADGELVHLEDADGTVPEDRLRAADDFAKRLDRRRSAVESLPIGWDARRRGHDFGVRVFIELVMAMKSTGK